MNELEIDFLTTPVETENGTHSVELAWQESRWLIGWGPWLGVDKGNVFEGHLALDHVKADGTALPVFMRGPHKEVAETIYDVAGCCDFFPSGTGRFVPVGDKLVLQLFAKDTGSAVNTFGIQASARIFSIKA